MHGFVHSPLTLLIVQLIVIVAVSRVIGRGARRIGQPMVIAEIIAGIVLGPSLLGWLAPEVMQSLFPPGSIGILKMLSQVGLILFMFLVGLELDPSCCAGRGHASVAISHASIVVPFALGVGARALPLSAARRRRACRSSPFTLFMGVAMSITAFPVLARILDRAPAAQHARRRASPSPAPPSTTSPPGACSPSSSPIARVDGLSRRACDHRPRRSSTSP